MYRKLKANKKAYWECKAGITLVELIVVLCIIAVLAGIFIPPMVSYIQHAKDEVCYINRLSLARYLKYVVVDKELSPDEDLSMILNEEFAAYLSRKDVCPNNGNVRLRFLYLDDALQVEIRCSKHDEKVIIELPYTYYSFNAKFLQGKKSVPAEAS